MNQADTHVSKAAAYPPRPRAHSRAVAPLPSTRETRSPTMTTLRRTLLLLPLLPATLAACADGGRVTGPLRDAASYAIADAGTGFKAAFHFLPPLVNNPTYSGTFDPNLLPVVVIHEGATCSGTAHARFSMSSGSGSEVVRLDEPAEHYIVNWHTDRTGAQVNGIYRICVHADEQETEETLLGYADVQLFQNGNQAKNASGDVIALVGKALPIKFRTETGNGAGPAPVAAVAISPGDITVRFEGWLASGPNFASEQLSATVTDAQGNVLNRAVTWASADPGIATVDGNGEVRGVSPGLTSVTATVAGISATVTVCVGGDVTGANVLPSNGPQLPPTFYLEASATASCGQTDAPFSYHWRCSGTNFPTCNAFIQATGGIAGSDVSFYHFPIQAGELFYIALEVCLFSCTPIIYRDYDGAEFYDQ